ncbi:MAG TPA: aminoacyl-tRNA hydrolase [Actinomycetota bacterium]|nr:aminoacyl-tRNA hydrolase [Actinomycetota bacterium]
MSLFRRSSRTETPEALWIVAGLGNPGDRYKDTRHNAGAVVLERVAEDRRAQFKRHKSGCLVAETDIGGERVVLARATSYMNESGRPLRELVRWYKGELDRLLVVHDELDVPFGEVRIKQGGGTAGHNGLGSLVNHLGTKDFLRVRVGIGRPRGAVDGADYVLQRFSAAERKELPHVIADAASAIEALVEDGPERAMNRFNTKPRVPGES